MVREKLKDDLSITDEVELWRRIHPKWIVRDANTQGVRVSSAAFDDSRNDTPTSVLIAKIVEEDGRTNADVLESFDSYALASLTAGAARRCNQGVARDPLPDEPAHAYVFGPKSKSNKRCLARSATWKIFPE